MLAVCAGLPVVCGAASTAQDRGGDSVKPAGKPRHAGSVVKGLSLGEKADGAQAFLPVGQTLSIRLPGNPTTGFSWELAQGTGIVAALQGGVAYQPAPERLGLAGAGGTFTAVFKALAEGRTILRLRYRRPWEKDVAPARVFSVEMAAFSGGARLDEGAHNGSLLAAKGSEILVKLAADDETLTQEMVRPRGAVVFIDSDFRAPRMAEGTADSSPQYLHPYHTYRYRADSAGEDDILVRYLRPETPTGPAVKVIKEFRVKVHIY